MSATGVGASTASVQEARPGANPRVALHDLHIAPIPISIAKTLVVRSHYLHSLPGGTQLAFGVFLDQRLMGALIDSLMVQALTIARCLQDCGCQTSCPTTPKVESSASFFVPFGRIHH